ncbi:MAG: diacylglycerol kinase family protein [Gemmataceae bacterium]
MTSLFRSFRFAFEGAVYLLRTQFNARIHLAVAIVVIAAGFVFKLSAIEWCLIAFNIAFVWSAEAFNTAIETLADRVTMERDPKIKIAKDVAAAATLFAAMCAAGTGLILFVPKIVN